MPTLSQDDCDLIARHPLNDTLQFLQKLLRDVEQSYTSTSSHGNATDDSQDEHRRLCSLPSTRRLIIQKASDFEIWSAVLDLITTLSRVTPLTTVPIAFDDTPITHSSALQQAGEQTRRLVEARVFEEIRHWDVEGFFEKYFEGKDWTRRASDVYESMRDRHVNGKCLVISPADRAIHRYESPLELLGALCDAIKAHRSLYLKGKILHQDISENNIIITDPKKSGGFMGVLVDLHLAKEMGSEPSGARCRTGTMEFKAIEVFLGVSHTYRHDLESFFYVLLWLCGRRGWDFVNRVRDRPTPSLLTKWYTGSYREIASAKRGLMHTDGLEDILDELPQEFDYIKATL
ncbi:MAG: hypothetical protein M1813_005438 [Trichoglossum hirsutum]|nr:MAG: hypothetical protein M1813_005438 [Trichoglossum hirsutum]